MKVTTTAVTRASGRSSEALTAAMAERRFGRIVFFASNTVWRPPAADFLPYVVSKAALIGIARSLAKPVGEQGITVNCVAPGRIDTDRLAHLYPDGPTDEHLAEIPLGRWGTPREFGDVVCFLASDRARYVTGQTILVDGGLKRFLF